MMIKKPQMNKTVKFCRTNGFLITILLGVVLGAVAGLVLRPYNLSSDTVTVISYPGELFMRALKLMVLPFIICCIIIGAATLNISKNKKIASRTLVYFVLTSLFNGALGIALAMLVHPGDPRIKVQTPDAPLDLQQTSISDGFLDMGRNIIPDNLFQATLQQAYTKYTLVKKNSTTTQMVKKLQYRDGTNTMGIIFFSLLFGAVLGTLGPKKQIIIDFFSVSYETLQKMLTGVIWFTPIGVASIICGKVVSVANLGLTLRQLSLFISTTVGGFLFYQLIVMQVVYYLIIRQNPYKYYFNCMPAIATAFATASKSASLPITFSVLEEKIKMNTKITRFVLPIGTINMDGSALYLCMALTFLAQINNMKLGLSELINLWLVCTATSMSSPAIPSAAIVLVVMLCGVQSIPTEDVVLLLAVDWFIDRFRTVNNLLGDCYTVAVVQHLSRNELDAADDEPIDTTPYNTTPYSLEIQNADRPVNGAEQKDEHWRPEGFDNPGLV